MMPLLEEGLGLTIHPTGTSMRPFVSGGRDFVIVQETHGRTLRRGDILLYGREDDSVVLHRIHHIKDGQVYCLGDSQLMLEGPIPPDDIYAVAVAINRKGRNIDCDGRLYRLASRLWLRTRPFRPLIFKLWDGLKGNRPPRP